MAKAKRKTLPKDFDTLLSTGDLDALKAIFDSCDLNARGGYSKQSALAFGDCPDALTRWLVEQGADIEAADRYGETPLHSRASHWQGSIDILLELGADVNSGENGRGTPLHKAAGGGNAPAVRLLLAHGARADARNDQGQIPLVHALQRCSNAMIEAMAEVAALLLPAVPPQPAAKSFTDRLFGRQRPEQSPVTPEMKALVQRIGENFEFHRAGFNADMLDATSAALDRLYDLFDVPPVPRREMHDGVSPIMARAARWQDRHRQLWEKLVPSSGAAATVQGEVIRISGKIGDEIDRNGGANWDADYRKMARAFLAHVGSGTPLPQPMLEEATEIISSLTSSYGETERMCELAEQWVTLNPKPMALATPDYGR